MPPIMTVESPFHIGDALVDPATRQVSRGSERRRLAPKAMAVLRALAAAAGQVVGRETLLETVWPDVTVGEEVLTHAIAEVRRALGDDFRAPRHVETVHKSGYRLLSPVRPAAGLGAAMAALDPFPAVDAGAGLGEWRPGAYAGVSSLGGEAFDLQDYAVYLRACDLFDRGGRDNVHAAAQLFHHLSETRPHFAPGLAGLARALTFISLYFGPAEDGLARALEVSERALRTDPNLPEAHAARGLVLGDAGDAAAAGRSFATAIRLRPDAPETHLMAGHASFNWGDSALAATLHEQVARLRADDYYSLVLAAKCRRCLGDVAGARANAAKAAPRIETHLRAYPDDIRAICAQARVMVELGDRDAALALIEPLLDGDHTLTYFIASLLARAGELSLALDRLEEVADAGWHNTALLRHDLDLTPLHPEPRYRRLEAALGVG